MAEPFDPEEELGHPSPDEVSYDLDRTLSSMVALRSEVPKDAYTAQTLGTERGGNGVVISDTGLVLTIGYLITEAETIWLVDADGKATAGHPLATDSETGFGLVQALGRLDLPVIEIGSSAALEEGDRVVVAGYGGRDHAIKAHVVSKREFAGYWEYVLDEGIFTAPGHPNWGGAGLIAEDGTLRGIGSLFVQHLVSGETLLAGNMIVPIDLLAPIRDDLVTMGRARREPRPWLGMFTSESDERLVVAGLSRGGPAHGADIRVGDMVVAVAGAPVGDLVGMYRSIWALGTAGVEVPLTLEREGRMVEVRVASADRSDFLKAPKMH
jgi:S1-C subfamily serine protease